MECNLSAGPTLDDLWEAFGQPPVGDAEPDAQVPWVAPPVQPRRKRELPSTQQGVCVPELEAELELQQAHREGSTRRAGSFHLERITKAVLGAIPWACPGVVRFIASALLQGRPEKQIRKSMGVFPREQGDPKGVLGGHSLASALYLICLAVMHTARDVVVQGALCTPKEGMDRGIGPLVECIERAWSADPSLLAEVRAILDGCINNAVFSARTRLSWGRRGPVHGRTLLDPGDLGRHSALAGCTDSARVFADDVSGGRPFMQALADALKRTTEVPAWPGNGEWMAYKHVVALACTTEPRLAAAVPYMDHVAHQLVTSDCSPGDPACSAALQAYTALCGGEGGFYDGLRENESDPEPSRKRRRRQ